MSSIVDPREKADQKEKVEQLNALDKQEAISIIDTEFQAIQQKQPWRWRNLLNLKRLWKGCKQAALNVGEHSVEESPWGKAAIGFLEGITEEQE